MAGVWRSAFTTHVTLGNLVVVLLVGLGWAQAGLATTRIATSPPIEALRLAVPASTTLAPTSRLIVRVLDRGTDVCGRSVGTRARELFQSHFWDGDVGLYHMRARMFDPRSGTFLSRDPSGYVDSVNLYAPMRWDMVNLRDPSGRQSVETDEEAACLAAKGPLETFLQCSEHLRAAGRFFGLIEDAETQVAEAAGDVTAPLGRSVSDALLDEVSRLGPNLTVSDVLREESGQRAEDAARNVGKDATRLALDRAKVGVPETVVLGALKQGKKAGRIAELRRRVRELGTDPKKGFRRAEGVGGVRIEASLGRRLRRSPDADADFIDDVLGPISLKGPIPARGSVEGLAKSAIKDALRNTHTNALFVDLRGLSRADADLVRRLVQAGTAGANKAIHFLE